ncbi:MAG: hypothetical protein ACRDTD_22920, partial [Pseudonocardiaceae bacterium]
MNVPSPERLPGGAYEISLFLPDALGAASSQLSLEWLLRSIVDTNALRRKLERIAGSLLHRVERQRGRSLEEE